MPVARLGGGALGDGDALLGGPLGRARRLARALGLAPRRFGHRALMRAGLLDAGLLGVAGGGEPARLGLDARLGFGVLGRDALDLLADLGQPVALAEPHRRRRRRAGAQHVAVPAPYPAVARHELLAGLQAGLQGRPGRLVGNDADEGETTLQLGHRLDVRAKRRGAVRQRRRIGDRAERQPVDRRPAIGRGFQLLAERRAQGLLEARIDGQRIEQRRPQRIGGRLQRRGDARLPRRAAW